MMHDVRQRPPQYVRQVRGHHNPPEPTSGPGLRGPEAWLQLQRQAGNAAVVAALGGRSATPSVIIQRASEDEETTPAESTALIDATRAGDRRTVKKLLRQKAAVDQRDQFGTTALIYAVDRRDVAIVMSLLDAGADPNLVSDETSEDGSKGDTALKVAVTNNDPAMVSMLMARGARMEVRDHTGLTVPAWAARRGSIPCLLIFLGAGWPINQVDTDGFTLLTWAATGGQLAMAQFLMANGSDPSTVPAALSAARKQSTAYRWHATDLASRQVPEEERATMTAAIAALLSKAADVDRVIAYLEQVLANGPPL